MLKFVKTFTLLIIGIVFISTLGVPELASAQFAAISCSAEEPCIEGQECVDIPNSGPICIDAQENYCDYYDCPVGSECAVAESYPPQVICLSPDNGDESENTAEKDISLDENVEAIDLGIKDPGMLPDSRLYFLKNWGRDIRSFLTFDKVKKAELKSKYANEKLLELKKLSELNRDPEIIKKAIKNYEGEIGDIETISRKIKDKASDNPDVDKFLNKFTEHQVLHHRVLQKLEDQVPEQALERIREAREEHLVRFGEVMSHLTKEENIGEKLEDNLERVKGSKFKDFKNLEILKELEDKVPEKAKEAIREVGESRLIKLKEKVEGLSIEDQKKFEDYAQRIYGEKEKQLEILDDLKSELKERPEIIDKLDDARSRIIRRLPAEIRTRNCPEIISPTVDFCRDGRIIPEKDEKGCLVKFRCVTPTDAVRPIERKLDCITLWNPVCGTDGKTYSNSCFAGVAEVEIAYQGICKIKPSIISPIEKIESKKIESGNSVESAPAINN